MSEHPEPPPESAQRPARPPADPVAVTAVASGLIGIVTLGLLLALVTGFLAAWAGQRARADGRSIDNAVIALGLAVLDGVVWLVLHFAFDISSIAG